MKLQQLFKASLSTHVPTRDPEGAGERVPSSQTSVRVPPRATWSNASPALAVVSGWPEVTQAVGPDLHLFPYPLFPLLFATFSCASDRHFIYKIQSSSGMSL